MSWSDFGQNIKDAGTGFDHNATGTSTPTDLSISEPDAKIPKACGYEWDCLCLYPGEILAFLTAASQRPQPEWVTQSLLDRFLDPQEDDTGYSLAHLIRNTIREPRLVPVLDLLQRTANDHTPGYRNGDRTDGTVFMFCLFPEGRAPDIRPRLVLRDAPDVILETEYNIHCPNDRVKVRQIVQDADEQDAVDEHIQNVFREVMPFVPIKNLAEIVVGYACHRPYTRHLDLTQQYRETRVLPLHLQLSLLKPN